MHAYELIELSALVAVNGRSFIQGPGRLPESSISQYWSACRIRFDRWAAALKSASPQPGRTLHHTPLAWRDARPILEEILTGEILTRIWTAAACQHDRRRGSSCISPVVRSVFLGHLEARNRALNFLLRIQDREGELVRDINRLRSRSERWTDMLLAYLEPVAVVTDVAFDAKRVSDFAEDVHDLCQRSRAGQAWRLLQAALRGSFGGCLAAGPANGDLNAQIAAGVLAGLRPDLCGESGDVDALWMQRLEYTAAEAEALVEELLAVDGAPASLPTPGGEPATWPRISQTRRADT